MKLSHAFIQVLTDGIDPYTGEIFPKDSPYQQPETIRALYTLSQTVEAAKQKPRNPQLPANAGKPWNQKEGARLKQAFQQQQDIKVMAKQCQRTLRSIEARLVRLGLVQERWGVREPTPQRESS